MLGNNAGAQTSCLGGCLLRSAPTRETLGTEVDYIKARALQVGFVIRACRRVVILFAQKSAVPGGGAGSCAPAHPLWAQSPGRTWVLPSSVRLRPATPLDKSNASSGRFQISQVESVAGPKDSESILPLPHHIPLQVRASMSCFWTALQDFPSKAGTSSVSHQRWSGLVHGELCFPQTMSTSQTGLGFSFMGKGPQHLVPYDGCRGTRNV